MQENVFSEKLLLYSISYNHYHNHNNHHYHHNHQHHHHHRHHLNHFCIVRVRDKYITVCNNSYIPLVIRMQILLMEKSYMSCCFSSFFARKQRFKASMPFTRSKLYAGKQSKFEKYVSSLLLQYYLYLPENYLLSLSLSLSLSLFLLIFVHFRRNIIDGLYRFNFLI